MCEMARRAGYRLRGGVKSYSHDEWNALGDWLYYQATGERDTQALRGVPLGIRLLERLDS